MSEVKMPPPLPNPPASGATPPPLPEVKPSTPPPLPKKSVATPPPLPQEKAAVAPPFPTNDPVAQNTPIPPPSVSQPLTDSKPVTAHSSNEVESEKARSSQALPPQLANAKDFQHGQPHIQAISPSKSSKLSRLVWLIGGLVGLAAVGGVGFYVFSKKEAAETPQQISKAQTESSASQTQTPNAPVPQEVQAPSAAAPEAAAPAPEASPPASIQNQGGDVRDERIKQLEQQLAQAELEKQKAQELTAQKKKPDINQAAAPATTAPAPAPAVSNGNPSKGYKPETRNAGEACNVNSDCMGTLKCNAGQCSAATKTNPSTTTSNSNSTTHLVDSYYVFNGSVKNLGNGFRSIYVVSNADVLPGAPYHGQVKSQVARYVMNCQAGQWGYDQLYFHASTFGDGQRIAAQEWQPNQVAFNPVQGALSFINKAYQLACR